MRARTSVLLEILRVQLWVVPTLAAALAGIGALVVAWIDAATGSLGLPLHVTADSARAIFSTIAGAMISFTALVFSVTMLVLQQASDQLSPRVTRTFLRDRFNQVVLGVFVAAFVYSLFVLIAVGEEDVPQLGVLIALALVLAAVIAFVAYLDHMAHAIRASSVIGSIADESRAVIERLYASSSSEDGPASADRAAGAASERTTPASGTMVVWTGASGYVQAIDDERLIRAAAAQGHDLYLLCGTGGFVVHGSDVLRIDDGRDVTLDSGDLELVDAIRVGAERTMAVDPEFGLRQLVDIALRALSPSLNDPSTAGQAIDRLHELLRQLQSCTITAPRVLRADAGPVVVVPAPDWDAYVHLAVDEIAVAARGMLPVRGRLRSMLEDLLQRASPAQLPVLRSSLASVADRDDPD